MLDLFWNVRWTKHIVTFSSQRFHSFFDKSLAFTVFWSIVVYSAIVFFRWSLSDSVNLTPKAHIQCIFFKRVIVSRITWILFFRKFANPPPPAPSQYFRGISFIKYTSKCRKYGLNMIYTTQHSPKTARKMYCIVVSDHP